MPANPPASRKLAEATPPVQDNMEKSTGPQPKNLPSPRICPTPHVTLTPTNHPNHRRPHTSSSGHTP